MGRGESGDLLVSGRGVVVGKMLTDGPDHLAVTGFEQVAERVRHVRQRVFHVVTDPSKRTCLVTVLLENTLRAARRGMATNSWRTIRSEPNERVLGWPESGRSTRVVSLDGRAGAAENALDRAAEDHHDANDDGGDQGEDQGVLGECLALFALEIRERAR